jgi:hypothetical protein
MNEPIHTPPQGHRIDAEIFSTGTWNGDTFTEQDLHELAANFDRMRGDLKPPLKFGHDEGQTLTGQSDGDPALGWVEALRVTGGKLIATFAGVPEVVYQAIRQGRYRRVSSEIYFNLRRGGETLGKVLKAVALLGADLPAVTNLRDLAAYLTGSAAWQADAVKSFTGPLRAAAHPLPEHATMSDAPPAALLAEQTEDEQTEDEPMEAELEELRAYKARHEQQQEQERRRRTEEAYRTARRAAAAFCEAQVRQGRLTPALRERLAQELDAQAQRYSAAAGLGISWELAQALLLRDAPLPIGSEAAFAADDPAAGEEEGDPSARLAALANRKMVELNLTYSQAAQYVLKTQPALARAYRDYTLNPSQGA